MGNKIVVDPAKLDAAATKIDEYAADYKKTYTQLFTEVTAMSENWSGADNVAYTNQIKGFEDDFTKMYTLMTQYSEFLKNSATNYRSTQEAVGAAAAKLTN